jgi:hypothetical protein
MNIDRYVKKVEVGAGETVDVWDGIQNVAFYDLNVHVVPKDNFTGTVKFYIGDDVAKTVDYNNENGSVVFAPTPPDYPEVFPPTAPKSYMDIALGEAHYVTGASLRAHVEIQNTGTKTVVFEVHFARKYK